MTPPCAEERTLFGKPRCRFEPRYDLGPVEAPGMKYNGMDLAMVLDALRSKTYVRDVCVRCGRTIEREAKP